MAWTMTTYDFEADGTTVVTEYRSPFPHGKFGNHGFHIKGLRNTSGNWIPFDSAIFVMVHDNVGLDFETLRKIAKESLRKPIYWSDERCRYWMYDFQVWDHWCEMIDVPDEPYWECLHINVYR